MTNLRGGVGQSLPRVLDAPGVRLNQIRDEEGVYPVFDVARLVVDELYCQDTRAWDTGAINQSTTSTQTITTLPPIFSLLGLFISADNSARISSIYIYVNDVGSNTAVREWPLAVWDAGDATLSNTFMHIGDTVAALLLTDTAKTFWYAGMPLTDKAFLDQRQGGLQVGVRVTSTAFGAGTVRCTGHMVIGFHRRDRDVLSVLP